MGGGPGSRDALEGKGPQRPPQRRLDRLEEVAEAVGGGYCRLQMPLRLALGVRGTVAGHRLGALEGGGGYPPPLPMHPCRGVGGGLDSGWVGAGGVGGGPVRQLHSCAVRVAGCAPGPFGLQGLITLTSTRTGSS